MKEERPEERKRLIWGEWKVKCENRLLPFRPNPPLLYSFSFAPRASYAPFSASVFPVCFSFHFIFIYFHIIVVNDCRHSNSELRQPRFSLCFSAYYIFRFGYLSIIVNKLFVLTSSCKLF